MLAPGTEIGNYVVEAELGRGGMACLFRVRHRVLGTVHALKVLSPELRASEELRSRFLGEGLIGAKLRHPHIVRVTDTLSTPEVAGLVMDLVKGPTLEQHIQKQTKPLSADEIRALFLPVLEAIGEAHRAGVIHRDIKPSNILLEERPDGILFPKVTDFGIAKIAEEAQELAVGKAATQVAARMGTPSYMSPEQVRGAKEVTIRSDIFSLGATLYELATLHMAFDGDTEFAIMEKIVSARYLDPEALGTQDPAIVSAIRKALEPDPNKRFANCNEFAVALTGPAPVMNRGAVPKHTTTTRKRPLLWPLLLLGVFGGMTGIAAFVLFGLGLQTKVPFPWNKKKPPLEQVQVKQNWKTVPPFSACLALPRPERVVLTRATKGRRFRDASELHYWFRNVPGDSVDVYLEEGRNGRSVVFELVVSRWPDAVRAMGDSAGEESCYRLGLLLLNQDVGRPMSFRLSPSGKSLEYEMVVDRSKPSKSEKMGTLEDALRPLSFERIQTFLR